MHKRSTIAGSIQVVRNHIRPVRIARRRCISRVQLSKALGKLSEGMGGDREHMTAGGFRRQSGSEYKKKQARGQAMSTY